MHFLWPPQLRSSTGSSLQKKTNSICRRMWPVLFIRDSWYRITVRHITPRSAWGSESTYKVAKSVTWNVRPTHKHGETHGNMERVPRLVYRKHQQRRLDR